jgi:hypothetical protein
LTDRTSHSKLHLELVLVREAVADLKAVDRLGQNLAILQALIDFKMMQAAVHTKHTYSYPRCEIQCCSVAVFAVLNAKTTKAQLPAILDYMKTLSFLWLSAISCLFTCLNGEPQVHGSLVAVML